MILTLFLLQASIQSLLGKRWKGKWGRTLTMWIYMWMAFAKFFPLVHSKLRSVIIGKNHHTCQTHKQQQTNKHTSTHTHTHTHTHILMPGMLSTGICRTPSLKQVRPGYTFLIWLCFLSISFLMICRRHREQRFTINQHYLTGSSYWCGSPAAAHNSITSTSYTLSNERTNRFSELLHLKKLELESV